MYLPAFFNESRIEVLHGLMQSRPLMTLVTHGASGLSADHLPVETRQEPAPLGSIRGHVARANTVWRDQDGAQALAIFQGPQVYISPSLYPTKAQSGEVVPTWDYAVVHALGTLRFIHDADWLRDLVAKLTLTHEASRPNPWQISDAPAKYIDKMLTAIVGFELSIVSLTGKWKVSQNRPPVDREGVIAGLTADGDADSQEIAHMLGSRSP